MSTFDLALSLLLLRLGAAVFLLLVLRWQLRRFGTPIAADMVTIRRLLFVLTLIVFLGQFVPIVLEVMSIFDERNRLLHILYAFSNASTALIAAFMLWLIYREAERVFAVRKGKR